MENILPRLNFHHCCHPFLLPSPVNITAVVLHLDVFAANKPLVCHNINFLQQDNIVMVYPQAVKYLNTRVAVFVMVLSI